MTHKKNSRTINYWSS